jgi:endonuclease V-like protein UPF0215 family
MHLQKKGLRALGIAESYAGRSASTLAGVVMRKDLRIDGFVFGSVTVGGTDATDVIIRMVEELDRRKDINVILLSGCVIAWFNIIDPERLLRECRLPVICITYEESEGLEADILRHFPGDTARLAAYRRLGQRVPALLHTRGTVYLRTSGLSHDGAVRFCNDFTYDGKVPEPLRVARLCARQVPIICPPV